MAHMSKEHSLGERIRRARLARGLTARELARKAKVDVVTLYRIERGTCKPRPTTHRKIAEALDKTPKLPEI